MDAIKKTVKTILVITIFSSSAVAHAESRSHTSTSQQNVTTSAKLKITVKIEPRLSMHLSAQNKQVRSNTKQQALLSREHCTDQQRCNSQPSKQSGLIYTSTSL